MVARIIFSTLLGMRFLIALAPALTAAAIAVAGCGSGGDAAAGGRVTVVATTTQAADIARNVGGSRVRVNGLLPANADPHDYEVRPDDVKALADAALVVRSGGELDEWLQGAVESAGADAPVLSLIDRVRRLGEDPHWWQDPRNGILAVAAVRDELTRLDPAGAAGYEARARAYTQRLRSLDAAVGRCMDQVPAAARKLVTTHDALGYFARRYGIEVVGAVIPSLSTQAQPSAGDVADLVDTIRRERVQAIFAESSVHPKVERAIARETGARVGRPLWADALGPAGSSGATYLGSLAANAAALVEGFSGGKQSCTPPS
jgi:ABC-type Zn uptake system ZnuABC Zn-binding protein ZnuA